MPYDKPKKKKVVKKEAPVKKTSARNKHRGRKGY